MKKKILISTGGSGGHVIPATTIYDHLKNNFEVIISTSK
jgi:UDP-N-acetylglucosamine--N-acetylmuramyl-(pentapeptide) pyrophosphoryl-undecaprenol N-acetylglucosamine transferase